MITFIISAIALFLGYILYSRYIERIAGADQGRVTPAYKQTDGVDFIPMPRWRVFLIQFLNIAGLGPIFGAIAGAMWGPVAFIWIVLGSIFAGAVHDYFSGMLSIRNNGASITEIVGIYLGRYAKILMRIITVVLLILVGVVFVTGPARILADMTSPGLPFNVWIFIVFFYYILATLLPVDKIIGKIYPVFGLAMIIMALGLIGALFFQGYKVPELSGSHFSNMHSQSEQFPIFPMLFVTIACGAISGFHATQSPLMARCIKNEKNGRSVFYGAMITEGLVALIWAAISMSFFGGVRELNDVMTANQGNAAYVVNLISNSLLGKVGGALALLGVVAAPLTSGDTAFRSARLIVADMLNLIQKPFINRLLISLPMFIAGIVLTQINFSIVWRYFAWTNQTLAAVVLWTITIYLFASRKNYWITLIPAIFMTSVVSTYFFLAPEALALSKAVSYSCGGCITLIITALFLVFIRRKYPRNPGL